MKLPSGLVISYGGPSAYVVNMTTMRHVMDWAGFTGDDLTSDKTTGGTLALLLGVMQATPPRMLALVGDGDALAVIQTCRNKHT